MKIESSTFRRTRVELDDNEYEGCLFEDCLMLYAGSGKVALRDNTFRNCQWQFVGAAERTLHMIQALYHGGAKDLMEATFDNIRQGKLGVRDDEPLH